MKNKDILQLAQGLALCAELKGIKIAYAVAKNNKMLQPTLEALNESIKKIQVDNSKKNEEGEPLIIKDQYQIEDKKKFEKEHKELMEIETEVTLHKIKQADLPVDISAGQLTGIFEIVEE